MPIFEYKCEKCGKSFEKIVKNSDEKVICEKCGSRKVEKLLSAFAATVSAGGSSLQGGSCSPSAGGL